MITQEHIDSINEYARRVKAGETLTEEELAERDELRRLYVQSMKESLIGHLENTTIVRPDGSKQKIKRKMAQE